MAEPSPGGLRAGALVVATPSLTEPSFARTVVLLLQADPDDGALGLVLNRPSGTGVREVLDGWADLCEEPAAVFLGGPVSPQGAICLGQQQLGAPPLGAFSSLENLPALGTVDLDAHPDAIAPAVRRLRVFAGYAGWAAGQLEGEVAEGAWFVLDALPADAFADEPELLWARVLRRQGPPLAFAASYPADPTLN